MNFVDKKSLKLRTNGETAVFFTLEHQREDLLDSVRCKVVDEKTNFRAHIWGNDKVCVWQNYYCGYLDLKKAKNDYLCLKATALEATIRKENLTSVTAREHYKISNVTTSVWKPVKDTFSMYRLFFTRLSDSILT